MSNIESIEYNCPIGMVPDNAGAVFKFIGPQPPCPDCNDNGEYETSDGFLRGCQACCSRLIHFIDYRGKRVGADWGDTIERHPDGLHLVPLSEAA
jgi:hypothetical protein